jgi:hypothetical protein
LKDLKVHKNSYSRFPKDKNINKTPLNNTTKFALK